MPHQDYLQRLINETDHSPGSSGGMHPLKNRLRGQAEAGQKSRSSPRLSKTGDKKCNTNTKNHRNRGGDNAKVKAGSIAARALAALQDDDDSVLPAPDTSRATFTPQSQSTPQSTTRGSTPSRQGQRHGRESWGAALKRKMQNAKGLGLGLLGSPAGSVASQYSGRSLTNINGIAIASGISSAQTAGIVVASRNNASRSVTNNNSVTAGEMRVAVSHSIDPPPTKLEICPPSCNPPVNRSMARGNTPGVMASSQNVMIDLTEDDSGEEKRQPMQQVQNNQMVQDNNLDQTSNKPKDNEKKSHTHTVLQDGSDQIVTDRVVDRTSNQEQNQETMNNAPKPRDMTEIVSNNREKQPMPTLNKENNNQPLHSSNKQQKNDNKANTLTSKNKTQPKNVGSKKSAAAASKRKTNAAGRNSVSAKRASAKKPAARILSCLLKGKLSYTEKDGNRCHIIRGYWEYENRPGSTPQRFELRRDIPSDAQPIRLASDGIFHGSFAYQCAPKGKPEKCLVIEESEVNLSFAEQNGELQSFEFALNGTGQNEFGKFDLVGTARKTLARDSYNLELRKKYTELFTSQVSQPNSDGNEMASMANSKKRKFSMLDASSGSEGSSDLGEKQSLRERELRRAISMSPKEFNASNDVDMFDEVAGNNDEEAEALTSMSSKPGGKTVFDVIQAVTLKEGEDKYDPVSMLLLQSEYYPSSAVLDENDSSMRQGSWQEFGGLQGINPSITARTLSWNVRNVKPRYSQMNLDFFYSHGIVNVQDFLEAKTNFLCSRLMAFDGFKAACAFEAWRRGLNRQKDFIDERQVKTFHDLYRPEYAKQSILNWKRAAESWYKKMSPPDIFDITHTIDTQNGEVLSEMEGMSGENQVQLEQNGTQETEGSSKMEEENSRDQVLLENIISSHEASILKNHCNICTAQELLAADGEDIKRCLIAVVGVDYPDLPEKERELIVEGMRYSWLFGVKEALQTDGSTTETSASVPPAEEDTDVRMNSSRSTPSESHLAFQTPLSYFDLQFIRSQNITSDERLVDADPPLLARRYVNYLGKTDKKISLADSFEVVNKWQHGARLVLGLSSREDNTCDTLPQNTRLLDSDSGLQDIMHTFPNLCKTVSDKENDGLPRRTIFTYDRENHVLYEFVVNVKQSNCSPYAGNGAFLTYNGAKILRSRSRWKKKGDIPHKQTRKPLDASFSTSGASVTLKGTGLHGDEHHFGPENDDSVGLYNEFTLADFADTNDNITFSSKHVGCALIELESRYAPLIPEDRKTDKVFFVKDFLFSNEPSSWRFDVKEELNGHPQVVDFTDDTTGSPHDIAESHMSMYVNEVGHNMDLVENVEALSYSPRSVTYYIHINKPMAKGETVELLVNYKEHYESMRERRGYGKANLFDGVESDFHDISRVQRNLKDRFLVEASILKFTEDEIYQAINFFKERVWDGVKAATSSFVTSCEKDDSNLLRQFVARRRIDWVIKILRTRFHTLLGRSGVDWLSFFDSTDSENCIFHKEMLVFVHDWPQNNLRPSYTGLATVMSVTKDKFNRPVFEVELPDGKYIQSVPEAVVTVPTDDDFKGVPRRTYSNWKKSKKQQDLPWMRLRMMKGFDTLNWDPSFLWDISAGSACASTSEMQTKIFRSLRWEFSEELLFMLMKNHRLSHPFDKKIWCTVSMSLLTSCLHLIADYLLMGIDKQILYKRLMGLARGAANAMRDISAKASTRRDFSLINNLTFHENAHPQELAHVVVVDAIHINRLSVGDYVKDPGLMSLDMEWYLIHQVILAVHPFASLIEWGPSSGTDNSLYSIDKLCGNIGLDKDASYLNFYSLKVREWRPLV